MSKKGTWLRVERGTVSLNHQGNSVESHPGVTTKGKISRLNVGWLKAYATSSEYNFPGQIVFDPDASSPLPKISAAKPKPPTAPSPKPPSSNSSTRIVKYTYDTQRDNKYKSGSACAPTSLSMACSAFGIGVPNGGEDSATWIYRTLERKYGQRISGTVGCMKALMEKEFGFKDEVVWSLSKSKLKSVIDGGGVIVLHTKAHSLTRSGHVIFISGYDDTGKGNGGTPSVVSGDPWGMAHRGSGGRYTAGKGHNVRYSYKWLLSPSTVLAAHILTHPTKSTSFTP